MRKTESQKIALCGMLGALSVVLLLIGSALQIGTYAAPMLAAFLIIPVLEEYGPRYALTLYATVSILAVLFVPETELAFFYVLVMGYYPVLRVKLNTLKNTVLRWVIKFAVFNAATVLVYLLLFALLGPAVLDELLADPDIQLIASAAIPSERCPLGLRVMAAGKDYFVDKAPMTSLPQLEAARRAVAKTGRKYMVYYSERLHSEAATLADYLIKQNTIGRVLHVEGFGPHRLGGPRPAWFYEKARYLSLIHI